VFDLKEVRTMFKVTLECRRKNHYNHMHNQRGSIKDTKETTIKAGSKKSSMGHVDLTSSKEQPNAVYRGPLDTSFVSKQTIV